MTSGSEPRTDLDAVAGLYSASLAEHGPAPQAVGWRDDDAHRLRFDKLAAVLPADGRRVTVADLGCGYGAFFEYLEEVLGAGLSRYVGYEISEEMAAAARRRLHDPRVLVVESATPTEEVDYSFACGTFNVKLDAERAEWDAYVKDQVRTLAATSRSGLAFNLLTTDVDWQDPKLFYADPDEYAEFCRGELSRDVRLVQGYGLYEWTMHVRLAE